MTMSREKPRPRIKYENQLKMIKAVYQARVPNKSKKVKSAKKEKSLKLLSPP